MHRLVTAALLLVAAIGTVHCAAPTDDAAVPDVDLTVEPKAISGASSGEPTGTDSVDKKPDGGKAESYLKYELKNVIITSY